MNYFCRYKKRQEYECMGMTALETLFAIAMLSIFTGVVAMVMEFTLRFFGGAESGEQNEFGNSNGVLIDHRQLHIAMDSLVEVLSQPGISKARLNGQERCPLGEPSSNCVPCSDNAIANCYPDPQISFDLQSDKPNDVCTSRPVTQWGLRKLMPEVILPPGYKLCLWSTTRIESSPGADGKSSPPGIYLLQALPEKITPSSLPTRRLFCRPRSSC